MKKSTTARRMPRQIGGTHDDDDSNSPASPQSSELKRPVFKPRKSTNLRKSLGPTSVQDDDDDTEESVVTPKRSGLSRVAIQRNASKRSSLLASQFPQRSPELDDDRPSYSADALRELKDSTPATPTNLSTVDDVATSTQALGLSSKFGDTLARYDQSSAHASMIPSATEIAEKKARRARLAKEEAAEYISLDPDDPNLDDEDLDDNVMRDDRGRLVLKPKDKYNLSESRLVHEDEDIMEGFDEFTEDGRIALGRKAEAAAARQRKQDMAAQIAEAEGALSDAESDDSDRVRTDAFVANQTRHGTFTRNTADQDAAANQRPKTPPIITPIPTLDGVIERLRSQLSEMQTLRMQRLREMESLQREKINLAEQEVRIQRALKETAEKFEALRKERGIDSSPNKNELPAIEAAAVEAAVGAVPASSDQDAEMAGDDTKEEEDEDEEDERPAFGGLGFGGSRPDLAGFGLGFQRAQDHESA